MKRITLYQSIRFYSGIKAWTLILILIATAVQPRASLGQVEKAFEGFGGLLMNDASIPEFVALSKLEGVFSNKEKSLKPLLAVKQLSLESRLKQAKSSLSVLSKRIAQAESEHEHWHEMIEEIEKESRKKSTIFPTSRIASEQLLIAAQLELQKVTWDLTSEVALFESNKSANGDSELRTQMFEDQLAGLESKSIEEELQSAQKELQNVERLEKKGAIDASEAAIVRRSVSKAKNSLEMHQLRRKIALAQQMALKNTQSAEVKMQIRKLTARKEQIEKYIKELFTAMKDLTPRELLLARVSRNEETIATLSKLQVELQTKIDEIEGLVSVLSSVDLADKKE